MLKRSFESQFDEAFPVMYALWLLVTKAEQFFYMHIKVEFVQIEMLHYIIAGSSFVSRLLLTYVILCLFEALETTTVSALP